MAVQTFFSLAKLLDSSYWLTLRQSLFFWHSWRDSATFQHVIIWKKPKIKWIHLMCRHYKVVYHPFVSASEVCWRSHTSQWLWSSSVDWMIEWINSQRVIFIWNITGVNHGLFIIKWKEAFFCATLDSSNPCVSVLAALCSWARLIGFS